MGEPLMSVPGKPGDRIMGCLKAGGPSGSCGPEYGPGCGPEYGPGFGPVLVLVLKRGGRLLERPPLVSEPLRSRSPEGLAEAGEA